MVRNVFFKKNLKIQEIAQNFQKNPLFWGGWGGGSHLRSAIPSISSALLISMSALLNLIIYNIYVVNQNDMLIKQKNTSLYC